MVVGGSAIPGTVIAVDAGIAPIPKNRLVAVLERAGRRWQLVDDLYAWISDREGALVFIAAEPPSPQGRQLLANTDGCQGDVVAVVVNDTEAVYRRWIRNGCTSVVNAAAPLDAFTLQIEGALQGYVVIPSDTTRSLVERLTEPPDGFRPDSRQATTLIALASGAKMPTIARQLDRSERHTRRLVRQLADQMGATNTHATVAMAVGYGWIPVVKQNPQPGVS